MRTWFDVEREKTFTAAYVVLSFLSLVGSYISVGFFKGAFIPVTVIYLLSAVAYIKMQRFINSYSIPFCLLFLASAAVLGAYSIHEKKLYFSAALVACVLFITSLIKLIYVKIKGEDEERNTVGRILIALVTSGMLILSSAPFGDAALTVLYRYASHPEEVEGAEAYQSGEYKNLRYGDVAFEILPEKDELEGAMSLDFAYRDYMSMETMLFDANTQYFLKVQYSPSAFEKVKADAKAKDNFPEILGETGYMGCFIERREMKFENNAYSFICYNEETRCVIYVVLVDEMVEDNCIEFLNTKDTRFLDHGIWSR